MMRGQTEQRLVEFGPELRRRLWNRDPEAMRVLSVVGRVQNVSVDALLDRSRPSDVARARQLALYLIHVCLRRNILEASRVFGRDRTTGSYACARIEERREDPVFDAEVSRLEAMIRIPGPGAHRAAG